MNDQPLPPGLGSISDPRLAESMGLKREPYKGVIYSNCAEFAFDCCFGDMTQDEYYQTLEASHE
jgi:hypothetical protein